MGVRDSRRLGAVEDALKGKITNRQGAERLKVSVRHFKRLRKRVQEQGATGLAHGNRGRPSPRRLSEEARQQIVDLISRPEIRINDHHAADRLADVGLRVSADTVRRLRLALRLPAKQRRRPPRHHRRRERAAQVGALAMIDGSPFAWLGPAHGVRDLVGILDDATGAPIALTFRPEEDLHGDVTVLAHTVRRYGVPQRLYGDGTSIAVCSHHRPTIEEELEGTPPRTQFGHMLGELGCDYVRARSPQAKGRIERLWRTLQDRLATELRLATVHRWDAAEAFLPGFIQRYTRQLARPPRDLQPCWQRPPRHLDRVFACRYLRTVGRDNVVSFFGTAIPIPPGSPRRSYHGRRVEGRELLDGRLLILHQGLVLLEQQAPPGPFVLVPRDSLRGRPQPPRTLDAPPSPRIASPPRPRPKRRVRPGIGALTHIRRPKPNHPWKRLDPNLVSSATRSRG